MERPHFLPAGLGALLALAAPCIAFAQAEVAPDSTIRANDAQPYDGFGYGLAVDGSNMLVGARGSDTYAINGGSIYAFTWTTSGWQQFQKLAFPMAQPGDGIGEALAISGAVGVAGTPGRGTSGSAFILRVDGGAWFTVSEVTDPAAGSDAEFGTSVACASSVVAIGAPKSAEGVGAYAGRVRVFRRSGTQWIRSEALTAAFPDPGDRFGFSLALANGWLAVGAPGDDDAGVNAGAVWLFRDVAGSFAFVTKLLAPGPATAASESGFGQSVAWNGGSLLVGAPRADASGPDSGAVYRFEVTPKGSSLAEVLMPPSGTPYCDFGFSVASSGAFTLVGAPGLLAGGQMTGGAFIFADALPSTVLLSASTPSAGLVGTRVAIGPTSMLASAPALPVAFANYAGQLVAIDRTLDCDANGVPDTLDVATGALPDDNGDGVPDECQCVSDLSGDGTVSALDLAIVLAEWGTAGSDDFHADLDGSGIVDALDLARVLSDWGTCAP